MFDIHIIKIFFFLITRFSLNFKYERLTDLTFEDEQNNIYEEYLVYIIPFKWWNENKDNFPILAKLFVFQLYL